MGQQFFGVRGARVLRWAVVVFGALMGAAFVVPVALSLLPQSWVGGWSDALYSRIVFAVAAVGCVGIAYRARRG
ncbi:hypothetical protein SRB5_59770 [Streptomyces sp. RB5]|uniref:Uncharacterized protein n=1 Tax=Streptomyces smaragdinus TaxID=2585196 RepID=A0A7K0CQN3_9ACTN|nr:hypothetical protein [Streptomyces smaragdinus]MQY15786.1 hypothetical protein [Streptomyces smaragdinus]